MCEVQCFEMEPSEVQDFKKHPLLGYISNFPIDFLDMYRNSFPFHAKTNMWLSREYLKLHIIPLLFILLHLCGIM